jgi:hypothetical protein
VAKVLLKKITAAVVFFTAALSLSAGEVTVKRLNYTIVLPENPSAACQLVGTELEHFLEKDLCQADPLHWQHGARNLLRRGLGRGFFPHPRHRQEASWPLT